MSGVLLLVQVYVTGVTGVCLGVLAVAGRNPSVRNNLPSPAVAFLWPIYMVRRIFIGPNGDAT